MSWNTMNKEQLKRYNEAKEKTKIKCDQKKKAQQHFKDEVRAGKIVQRYLNQGIQPQHAKMRQKYGVQIDHQDLVDAKNKALRGEKSEFEKAIEALKAAEAAQKKEQDVLKASQASKDEVGKQPLASSSSKAPSAS